MSKVISALLAINTTTGCATLAAEQQPSVFADPARFVGQEVYICGRLSGTSNIYSSYNKSWGLSILATEVTAPLILQKSLNQRSACFRGTIEDVGCDTSKEIICTDWAFDHAINVAEVE
ncbi:hypothetical protein [Erythrobacter mangrovi]|uniref:Uncharacterized protein n=1 Tax=Erythrobacter mangrovi TaxID=2739433 RepID=A0A7D4BAN3_9SPHN|nr:hypothetical protein [Erythrobacter mangrovi]QKG71781.1 hypothetical protein HQR01_10650 [Erythrobacter mangrovi]